MMNAARPPEPPASEPESTASSGCARGSRRGYNRQHAHERDQPRQHPRERPRGVRAVLRRAAGRGAARHAELRRPGAVARRSATRSCTSSSATRSRRATITSRSRSRTSSRSIGGPRRWARSTAARTRHHIIELPGDVAQTYVRDPAGNLMEIDTPGASRLPEGLRREMRRLGDIYPQSEVNRRARLYVHDPAPH